MMNSKRAEKIYLVAAMVVLWVSFASRLAGTAVLGTQSDEGVHMVLANQVSKGDVLYADLFENRTPLVEWALAAVFSVSGTFLLMGRLLTVAASTITVAGLLAASRRLRIIATKRDSRSRAAHWTDLIGASLFALSPMAIFWSRFVLLEPWQVAVSLLAIINLLTAVSHEKRRHFLVAGLWSGIALLTKQTALILVASIILYLAILTLKRQLKDPQKALVSYAAGAAVPLAIFVLILLLQGALQPFMQYMSSVDRLAPLEALGDKLLAFFDWTIRQPAAPLAVGAGLILITRGLLKTWIIPIWATAETLALFAPPAFEFGWGGFSHYALPVIAATCLLAGIFFYQIRAIRGNVYRQLAAAGVIFAVALTLVSAGRDLVYVLGQRDYPQPDQSDEEHIAGVINRIADPGQPVLVFANSIFYLLSDRPLPDVLYQLPQYLPESQAWNEFEPDLIRYLEEQVPAAFLVSRLHLESRFTDRLNQVLWQLWNPVDLLSYPYQDDVILFLPLEEPGNDKQDAIAEFESGLTIHDLTSDQIGARDVIVKLDWSSDKEISHEPAVFVHMVSLDGQLISQKDGPPVTGFRPFSTWVPGEHILDWRLITVPVAFNSKDYEIRVGIYDPATGDRYHLRYPESAGDYYSIKGQLN